MGALSVAIGISTVLLVTVLMVRRSPDTSISNAIEPGQVHSRFLQAESDVTSCSGAWEQCGGTDWPGPVCCDEGLACEMHNEWYSQCTPVADPQTTMVEQKTKASTTPDAGLTAGCSAAWEQCGGSTWAGPQCCGDGFACEVHDEWYSQCTPVPSQQTTTTTTYEAGLMSCSLPVGTADYSLITQSDATICAHDVYSGIAIGGRLLDGSPEEHGNIGAYCTECPAIVSGDCPISACGASPNYSNGTFNFKGKPLALGASIPFAWTDFEQLARTARPGVYTGGDGCDEFSVHVSNIGGEFSMSDFCTNLHGCNPEDNGCTLIIFNTSDRIILNQGYYGRQFGPSVIAPFSGVTLLDTAGYVDGLVVAKWFGGHVHQVGEQAGSLQMHGKVYRGPIFCKFTTTTTTIGLRTTLASASSTTKSHVAMAALTSTTSNILTKEASSTTSSTTNRPTSSTTTTTTTTNRPTSSTTTTTSTTNPPISSTTTTTSTTNPPTSTTTTTTSTTNRPTPSTTTTTSTTNRPTTTTTSTTNRPTSSTTTTTSYIATSTTTVSVYGAEAYCVVFGAKHIAPFDGPKDRTCRFNDIFLSGDFWLVQSEHVHIQVRYWADRRDGGSSARALAIGGPFLQGNTLIIEQQVGGNIYWNGREILYDCPSEFQVDGLIYASSYSITRNSREIDIKLPLGVKIAVNRLKHHINMKITMRRLPGGQDGHCGNFNGIAGDDDTASIKARFGTQVPGESLLFEKKEYVFMGCFADLKSDRDLPVRIPRKHLDIVGCSVLCSGYKYFARQGRGKCFCGNDYGKHGATAKCSCGAANVGRSKNCVYQNVDATQDPHGVTLHDCPQDRRQLGERKCEEAFGLYKKADFTPAYMEACIFDFCFGSPELVEGDAAAAATLG